MKLATLSVSAAVLTLGLVVALFHFGFFGLRDCHTSPSAAEVTPARPENVNANNTVPLTAVGEPRAELAEAATLLRQADRAVLEGPSRAHVVYGKVETQKIVAAALGSVPDSKIYRTPVGLYVVRLYAGEKLLAELPMCSDLFMFNGKQYRDDSEALSRLVDQVLSKAAEVEQKTRPE